MSTRDQSTNPQRSSSYSMKLPSHSNNNNCHQSSTYGNQNHHNHKIVSFEPFCLLSEDDKSLKQAVECVESASLNRFRVCVVAIISKAPIDGSIKNGLVQSILSNGVNKRGTRQNGNGRNKTSQKSANVEQSSIQDLPANSTAQDLGSPIDDYENQVVGQVDTKANVIVLNFTSFLQTDKLYSLVETIDEQIDCKQTQTTHSQEGDQSSQPLISNSWPEWNQNIIKTLLILLLMSHIVVFYNPDPSIDYSLIQLFKILETLRLKSQNRITDLLETIASNQMFPQQWIRQGRLCCPRAVFVCDCTQLDVKIDQADIAAIKRDLEDQIYILLKRANITNRPMGATLSSNQQTTLFSLPDRDDFVFIITEQDPPKPALPLNRDQVPETQAYDIFYSKLFKSLKLGSDRLGNSSSATADDQCSQSRGEEFFENNQDIPDKVTTLPPKRAGQNSNTRLKQVSTYQNRFRKFMNKHIADIHAQLSQNEQDNGKHYVVKQSTATLLPRYDDFFTVLLRLKCLFFPVPKPTVDSDHSDESIANTTSAIKRGKHDNWSEPDERRFVDIYDLVNVDELFSKCHCYKTRLAAFDFYKRGLQVPLLNNATHSNSLESAQRLYLNHARGSACASNLNALIEQCNKYWQNLSNSKSPANDDIRDGRYFKGNSLCGTLSSEIPTSSCRAPNTNSRQFKSNPYIVRQNNGIKMMTHCDCGRQSKFLIAPIDQKKKLERVDILRIND